MSHGGAGLRPFLPFDQQYKRGNLNIRFRKLCKSSYDRKRTHNPQSSRCLIDFLLSYHCFDILVIEPCYAFGAGLQPYRRLLK